MKNISKTTKTILFASLIAALILPFSGLTDAYAVTDADQKVVEKLADKHARLIDRLANLNEKITNATSDSKIKRIDARIAYVESQIQIVVEKLNGYNLFTDDQTEELEAAINPTNEALGQEVSALCECDPELAFRSNFQYKWGSYTGYTPGNWVYSSVLSTDETSVASISWLNPDWVKPYVQAYMSPSGGGEIFYHVEITESVGEDPYKKYPDRIKGIQGTGPYNANIWWESKYYQTTSYDKVLTIGNVESFP